jgi:hypothetical protein
MRTPACRRGPTALCGRTQSCRLNPRSTTETAIDNGVISLPNQLWWPPPAAGRRNSLTCKEGITTKKQRPKQVNQADCSLPTSPIVQHDAVLTYHMCTYTQSPITTLPRDCSTDHACSFKHYVLSIFHRLSRTSRPAHLQHTQSSFCTTVHRPAASSDDPQICRCCKVMHCQPKTEPNKAKLTNACYQSLGGACSFTVQNPSTSEL